MQASNEVIKYNKLLIAQRSSWLFMARLMPTIVFILITIIYSRQLSYHDYGLFQSVWMYTNVISVTIGFGIYTLLLSSDLPSFFSFYKKNNEKILSFYLALSALTFVIFLLTAKNIVYSTRSILLLFIVIQTVTTFIEALLIKKGREKFIFISNFFYSLVFFAWHYQCLQNPFDLHTLIFGVMIISAVRFLLFFVQIKKLPVAATNTQITTDQWAFLGLNDLLSVFARWIDKLVLIYLLTPKDFALFFNGSIEIPLFGMIASVIGSIMLVEIASKIDIKKHAVKIFNESFLMLSCVVFPVFWFLLLYRNELFFVAFGHKYDASIPIFLISLMIVPLRINNYSVILQCYNKSNEVLKGSVYDILIALALMPILYYFFGVKGITLSIVISTYFQLFYYLKQSAKVLNIPILHLIPIHHLFKKLIITAFIYLVVFFAFQNADLYIRLSVSIVLTIIVIGIDLYSYFKKDHLLTKKFTGS
jgi:O-antigen/teichoic acid export membrane protein